MERIQTSDGFTCKNTKYFTHAQWVLNHSLMFTKVCGLSKSLLDLSSDMTDMLLHGERSSMS